MIAVSAYDCCELLITLHRSWNINGLRAQGRGDGVAFRAVLDAFDADIICLQETKTTSVRIEHSSHLLSESLSLI